MIIRCWTSTFAVVVLILGTLGGCSNSPYTSLGGSYYLNDYDDSNVSVLKKEDGRLVEIIGEQVLDYKIERNYALLLRQVSINYECFKGKHTSAILALHTSMREYWVLDLDKSQEYGPLDAQAFKRMLIDLNLQPVKFNESAAYAPDRDVFERDKAKCTKLIPISPGEE